MHPEFSTSEARRLILAGKAPQNMHVGGWLDISGTAITALPEGLHVGGSLDISCTAIAALPEGLHVGGWLDISGTAITALYADSRGYRLYRAGDRYIAGCRNFTVADALAHWGSPSYPNRARGDAYCAAIRAEEARRKGGPDAP